MKRLDVNERVAAARDYFAKGYNCSQSVVLAYADFFGVDENILASLSSSFGGGMGRMGEVCGAVSAMAMLAGLIKPATDLENKAIKAENYALMRDLADKFRAQNGAIVCRELLAQGSGRKPCAELVADAARIVGEQLSRAE